jgi:putative addiction module killer protein
MTKPLDQSPPVLYTGQSYSLEQTELFADWLTGLRDTVGRARILKRLVRLSDGQFGDVKPVGDGVHELRMFFGPGYRVYYMQVGDVMILLLAGGDKDSQERDIERAKELARIARDGIEDDQV